MKCLRQVRYVTKASQKVIEDEDWPKNAQISESDFKQLRKLGSCGYLSNFKFSGGICYET